MVELARLYSECARVAGLIADDTGVSGVDVGYPDSLEYAQFSPEFIRVRIHRNEPLAAAKTLGGLAMPSDIAPLILNRSYTKGTATAPSSADPNCAGTGRRAVQTQLRPGVSISRDGNTRHGTLGLIVRRTGHASTVHFGLSCAHVLQDNGAGSGQAVRQPACLNRGNAIGTMYGRFDGLHGDAAIFQINSAVAVRPQQYGTNASVSTVRFAKPGDHVHKSGAATGLTCGIVEGVGFYRLAPSETLMMGFCVRRCEGDPRSISADEDSGAIWYHADDEAGLGLHTGAIVTESGRCAIASHLPCILSVFDVTALS